MLRSDKSIGFFFDYAPANSAHDSTLYQMGVVPSYKVASWQWTHLMMYRLPIFLATVLFVSSVSATRYGLSENIVGSKFLDAFTFQTIADPTHGRVCALFNNSNFSGLTTNEFFVVQKLCQPDTGITVWYSACHRGLVYHGSRLQNNSGPGRTWKRLCANNLEEYLSGSCSCV